MSPYLAMTAAISMRSPLRGSVYPAFRDILMAILTSSEGADVPFLPPKGLENVHTAFQDEMSFCTVVPAIGAE